jgi:hypothetical protein
MQILGQVSSVVEVVSCIAGAGVVCPEVSGPDECVPMKLEPKPLPEGATMDDGKSAKRELNNKVDF